MKEKIFSHFPIIATNKDIILRQIDSEQDATAFLAYMLDPQVRKYIPEDCRISSQEQAVKELSYWGDLFHKQQSVYWGIALQENNQLIGTCGFNKWSIPGKTADISYDLAPPYWGKGIMKIALTHIIDFAFKQMEVNYVFANVSTNNIRSWKLLEKLDFTRDKQIDNYYKIEGEFFDSYLYVKINKNLLST